jgi:O-antigen/teichoic acid export membrane protein
VKRRPRPPVADQQPLGDRAFGGAVWGTVQTVVLLPVNFLGTVLVARLLGPGDLGSFVALMVFLSISAPLLDFGFGTAMQQWVGRAVAAGDADQARGLFRKALGFRLLVQLPGILAAAAYLLRDSPSSYFWSFAAMMATGAFLGSVDSWLVAHNRLALGAKRFIVAGIMGNVVLVAVAAAGGSPELMWLARQGVQLLPALAVLFALPWRELRILLVPQMPRHMPSGFWAFARPMWLTVVLGAVLSTRTEVYLLQWNGLAAPAGVFAVTFGLATQVTGIFSGIHSSFAAAAITLSGHSEQRLQRALLSGHAMFAVLASAALAASAGLPHLVVPLYGAAYASAGHFVLPIVLATTLQASLTAFGVGALVRRQRRRLLVSQAIAVALDIGLAAALIPFVGLAGAVLGAAAGLAAVNAALLVRELGLRRAVGLLVRGPWLKAGLAAYLAYLLGFASPNPWLAGVTASILALTVHLLVLRWFHQSSLVELFEWLGHRLPERMNRALRTVLISPLAEN